MTSSEPLILIFSSKFPFAISFVAICNFLMGFEIELATSIEMKIEKPIAIIAE